MLIPKENVKDLEEIPDNVKRDLNLIPVDTVDEVLKAALVRMPEPAPSGQPQKLPEAPKSPPPLKSPKR